MVVSVCPSACLCLSACLSHCLHLLILSLVLFLLPFFIFISFFIFIVSVFVSSETKLLHTEARDKLHKYFNLFSLCLFFFHIPLSTFFSTLFSQLLLFSLFSASLLIFLSFLFLISIILSCIWLLSIHSSVSLTLLVPPTIPSLTCFPSSCIFQVSLFRSSF